MSLQSLSNSLTRFIVPVACLLSIYLYLYPIFHGCAFPATDGLLTSSLQDTARQHISLDSDSTHAPFSLAPFRLLVLADPQLEGDSSLPKPENGLLPKLRSHWAVILNASSSDRLDTATKALRTLWTKDLLEALRGLRKRVDLFGNDYYLAHIFRTLNWWSRPTHITVLGDLIGSQWVTDDEFEWRGWRFWNRVFTGGKKVDASVIAVQDNGKEKIFNIEDGDWRSKIINIAGNHDIGYAGDISDQRMDRFERVFGSPNWDVRFELPLQANESDAAPTTPSIHLVVLNSLLLDTPALSDELQGKTYEYLNSIINTRVRPVEDRSSFVLLLTHLPLFKKEGVCIDPPHFGFFGSDSGGGMYKPHGLKEQNHLSQSASEPGVLETMFGMKGDINTPAHGKGRPGLILTGHDHEGCDTWHFIPANTSYNSAKEEEKESQTQWETIRWRDADVSTSHTGVREVTLRSMMGDFGGNAGLLSAWFDVKAGEWRYQISMCRVGVQHIWWTVHVIDGLAVTLLIFRVATGTKKRELSPQRQEAVREDKK